MSDQDEPHPPNTTEPPSPPIAASPPALPPTQADAPSPHSIDRTELLQRARAFLVSPQVRHEDAPAKRRFLAEKGLTDQEIDGLLHEVPPPAPSLPPRTYPQPPPSRIPYLLLNAFRALTWLAGGSAALLLAYFRFLYPKIAQTYQARLALCTHRSALLERLAHSLEDLKATQRSTFAVLPAPEPFREPAKYAECHGLDQLTEVCRDEKDVPPVSLLRCAIEECAKHGRDATSAELFRTLETKISWVAEDDAQYEETLWQTLMTTPVFQPAPSTPFNTTHPAPVPSPDTIWTYAPPTPPPGPPLLTSLTSLKSALPLPPTAAQLSPFQHTFQSLSDLTGYIATQTYGQPHGFRTPGMMGMGMGIGNSVPLSPEEEEVRREIRALKGLVLNRRSFMPRPPRPGADGSVPAQ